MSKMNFQSKANKEWENDVIANKNEWIFFFKDLKIKLVVHIWRGASMNYVILYKGWDKGLKHYARGPNVARQRCYWGPRLSLKQTK
jgi:hypothetical protein